MSDTTAPARELRDYGSLLRRRWSWLVLGLLIGAVLAVGYLQVATPTYASTAQVQVYSTIADDTSATGERTLGAVNLDTEAQVVRSEEVAARVAEELQSQLSPVQLSRRVTVTVPPNSTVLYISFEAPDADLAQQGAQAFADGYLAVRGEKAQGQVDADLNQIEAQIGQFSTNLEEVEQALNSTRNTPSPTERSQLRADQIYFNSQLTALGVQRASLASRVVDPGETIFEAQVPGRPQDPNPLLILPSGLMAGLLLGLGMALLRERTDRRLHTNADVERVFGLPVLARLDPRKSSVPALMSGAPVDHEIRALFHNIEAVTEENVRIVLVAAPATSQPVGEVARALSLVAARTGARTSYLTRLNGSDALLSAAWQRLGRRGDLKVANYSDMGLMVDGELRSAALIATIKRLRRERDFVVMDSPSGDTAIDIPVIAKHADVVLVAIELGRTSRTSIQQTLSLLTRSGAGNVYGITIRRGRRRRRTPAYPSDPGDSPSRPIETLGATDEPRAWSQPRREEVRSPASTAPASPQVK